jgi:hypothetical protein
VFYLSVIEPFRHRHLSHRGPAPRGEAVLGLFEYHTSEVTSCVLDDLLAGLVAGTLSREAILT